jgi:hypothetical protein
MGQNKFKMPFIVERMYVKNILENYFSILQKCTTFAVLKK